jgi:hypothetical protein
MVEVWNWIIGYAVLFALVQFLIYTYYVRRGNGTASGTGGDTDDYHAVSDPREPDRIAPDDVDTPDAGDLDDDSQRRCPHCGTPNDATPTVKYCQHCTRALG